MSESEVAVAGVRAQGRFAQGAVGSRARARLGWVIFTLALVGAAVVILATMQTGLQGDPRVTNPTPGPAPYPPFLGVENWPLISNVAAAVTSLVLLGVFLFLSVRQRRLHWGAIVFLAVMFMGVLDPIANWATFTVFDPRIGHFPRSWPWMRFAPLLQPSFSFLGGYAGYYFTVGLGLYWLHQRLVAPRVRRGSWHDRHPLLTLSLTSFVISLPIDLIMLFGWLRLGIVVFVEGMGPILHWGHVRLPLGMVLYDSWPFLFIPVLCHRDEHGRSVVLARLAQLLPSPRGAKRTSSARQLLAGTAFMLVVGLVPVALFSALRVTHQFRPSYDRFPFPQVKVYDPYGDVERAGKPGPFYR